MAKLFDSHIFKEPINKEPLDFSNKKNYQGPPFGIRALLQKIFLRQASRGALKDKEKELKINFSKKYKLTAENIMVEGKSLDILIKVCGHPSIKRLISVSSEFQEHIKINKLIKKPIIEVKEIYKNKNFESDFFRLENVISEGDLVYLEHPHLVTGRLLEKNNLIKIIQKNKNVFFYINEELIDYAEEEGSFLVELKKSKVLMENVMVVRPLATIYGLHSMDIAIGFGFRKLKKYLEDVFSFSFADSWQLDLIFFLLTQESFIDKTKFDNDNNKKILIKHLQSLKELEILGTQTNFLLCRWKANKDEYSRLVSFLKDSENIIIAARPLLGDDQYVVFSIVVKPDHENKRLVTALECYFKENKISHNKMGNFTQPRINYNKNPGARTIMFQGTRSNVGKSMMTTALCRLLKNKGVKIAPFKSQNMSNNSFVTREGREIARAQAVQAQACGLKPDHRFSPILLKPYSNKGSQVIMQGRPVANMSALEYEEFKKDAFEVVLKEYASLRKEYEVIVLEGAGSPSEINLKHSDIVNMNMAAVAQTPVFLVGDINLGGVFSSFAGTVDLMEEWERRLVKGFLINQFRGDKKLLGNANELLLDQTGIPIMGVMPYMESLRLPEEDSVNFKSAQFFEKGRQAFDVSKVLNSNKIIIGVIDFPHISNFTDIEPLLEEEDVHLVKINEVGLLGHCDIVILPGSKNTFLDLKFLKSKGLDIKIKSLSQQKKMEIIGLCGGFQMLGTVLTDPTGLESNKITVKGIGLLDLETVWEYKKTLKQVTALHLESKLTVEGYEIHHGKSKHKNMRVLFEGKNSVLGLSNEEGTVWGTYIHGIFDNDHFRNWFLDKIWTQRG